MMSFSTTHLFSKVVVCGAALTTAALLTAAHAEESQFGYVYTTDLLPKGAKEVEQWATWRHQKVAGKYDEVEGRTEVEYGLTDNLQGALYANYASARAYHNGPDGATTPPEQFADKTNVGADQNWHGKRFVGVSGELIYRALSPYTDPIGLAFYFEPVVGPKFREIESKIILQKNFLDDRLVTAFNATYAPEWRLVDSEKKPGAHTWNAETDINYNFAASYRFAPNWSAGMELVNEHEYNSYHLHHETNSGYFTGPSIHYGGKQYFVTVTALEQLPWATGHGSTVDGAVVGHRDYDNDYEKFRLRVKAGFYF